jgi:hypothetical protein
MKRKIEKQRKWRRERNKQQITHKESSKKEKKKERREGNKDDYYFSFLIKRIVKKKKGIVNKFECLLCVRTLKSQNIQSFVLHLVDSYKTNPLETILFIFPLCI